MVVSVWSCLFVWCGLLLCVLCVFFSGLLCLVVFVSAVFFVFCVFWFVGFLVILCVLFWCCFSGVVFLGVRIIV